MSKKTGVEGRIVEDITPDFDQLTDKERRALLRRLRSTPYNKM